MLSDVVRLYHTVKEAGPGPTHVLLSLYDGMWHVFQQYMWLCRRVPLLDGCIPAVHSRATSASDHMQM
jgi:hypothetical protein